MIKKTILIAACLACFSLAQAQEPSVKWGEPISSPSDTRIFELYQTEEKGFYAFRKTINSLQEFYWLDKYNDSYKLLYSKEIRAAEGVMGDNVLFRSVLPLKDKMVAFYTGFKKATKESWFFCRNILPNGDVEKKDIKLEGISADKGVNSGSFEVVTSPDKSKLLLVTSFPFEKEQKAKIRVKAFETESFKELWSKEVTLNYDSKKGSVVSLLIDNAGNAYLAGRYNAGKKFEWLLWTYNATTAEWKENAIDMKEKTISDDQHKLMLDATGNVVFSGFLYDGNKDNFKAIFYVRVNGKTQAVEAVNQLGYGDTALKEKDDVTFYNWRLRGILSQSNGNILVIGEDEFGSKKSLNTPGSAGSTMTFNYDYKSKDIKVLSIKPDGSKNWITTIDKNQNFATTDPNLKKNGFVYTMVNDRLFIVYNCLDLAQTLHVPAWSTKEADGTSFSYKNFAMKTQLPTFLYIVEPNGNLTYGNRKYGLPLFNFQNGIFYEMSMNSFSFIPLPDGIIMMDQSNEKYQFGKITF